MKAASQVSQKVVTIVKRAEASFDNDRYRELEAFLTQYVTENDLGPINDILTARKLRKLTTSDIVKIAFVHTRSVIENEGGRSPYSRIISYFKANGEAVTNLHVKAATELLIQMEYLKIHEAENRKKKLCRSYRISDDAATALNLPKSNSRP